MSMSVLITGGTGFIGANLAKAYVEQKAKVHLIIRENSNLSQIESILQDLHLHSYDGGYNSLDIALQEAKPDIVFHLGSLTSIEHHTEEIENLIQSNITFGTFLVEAMIKNGVKNFINTGTFWQHYENDVYNPVNLYAATKEAFEKILKYYAEIHALRYTTLKLFDTYGPNDPRKKVFNLLEQWINSEQSLDMSPGEQLIDIVYIDDVVQAFMLAAEGLKNRTLNNDSYAISSGKLIQLKELVGLYLKTVKSDRVNFINWGGRPYRHREVMIPWNQGERLPGWEPRVSLEEGLIAMINN